MEYLINKLRQSNIRIGVVNNQLKLSIPEGIDAKGVIQEVRDHKQALIDYILKARTSTVTQQQVAEEYGLFYQQKKEYLRFLIHGDQSFNMNLVLKFDNMNVPAMQKAVLTIFERHESLRTTYRCANGVMQQHIHSMASIGDPIRYMDLSAEDDKEAAAHELLDSMLKRKFNFEKELLADVRLVKVSEQMSCISFTVHHVSCDTVSRQILWREIETLYEAYSRGKENPLPPVTLQYKDYARFVNNFLQSEAGAAAKEFYMRKIGPSLGPHGSYRKKLEQELKKASVDYSKMPFTEAFGSVVNLYPQKGALFRTCIKQPTLNRVKELAMSCGSSVNMTLTAAFAILLKKFTGRNNFRFHIPFTNRTAVEFENIVGWLTSEIILAVDVKEGMPMRQLIEEVTAGFLEASPHQLYPHEAILNDIDVPLNELVDAMLNFVRISGGQMEYFAPVHNENGSGHFNLRCAFSEFDNGIDLTINYNLNAYTKEQVEEMMDAFTNVLSYATRDCLQPVAGNYQ
jgi:hypothetical protein